MVWGYYGDGSLVGWLLMGVTMLLVLGGLVAGAVIVARHLAREGDRRGDAVSILQERFARGEIDTDEYTERRQHLSSS